ncbi:ABC transporter substrate-binding protein [Natrarchaeobius oligotrophus]|uniref:ABC transporter substrate-binding protein n=1 Tax=Natrarchaeobius chitinivorans TaxID=1679083 RepID=A0A3N6PEF5_NATCH|nr:ABC transporter substrate-binding protein [Natrarchaeobius chitinivorans]RQG95705.1 ABC transporter substrate-binding protein [Natrarchaeobius chitinivorans]
MDEGASSSRRRLLAGAGGVAISALAGCSEAFWSRAENTGPEQVELTIKTVPADDDPFAAKILSQLRESCEAAGIDVTHVPSAKADLYREILLERDYDVFVARHPGLDEYDALYGLLHSQFVTERGWQNPFQFSDPTVDELLEAQRADGGDRQESITELVDFLEDTAPYSAIAFPHLVGGARTDVNAPSPPQQPLEYLDLLCREPDDGPRDEPLVVGVAGEDLANRLNPIAVDRNRVYGLLGLLYDPLVRRDRDTGEYIPWLAESVTWTDEDRLQATITLREGVTWHDGTDLTTDDVDFTVRFLGDTALGSVDGSIPAPRFRSRQTLVSEVQTIDSRTVTITFGDTVGDSAAKPTRDAAVRSLTIPLLPEHVWEPRSEVIAERQTEALVTDNEEPIGSGLFRLDEVTADGVELEPFDEHVFREFPLDRPDALEGFSQYDGLRFRIDPNVGAMVDALENGDIDVTASNVPPERVESIRDGEETTVISSTTDSFYLLGYNLERAPLVNHRFRQILSRLVDREYVVSEFFDGFAEPAMSPRSLLGLADDEHDDGVRSSIAEFPGTDGEVDDERVRTLFEEASYQYEDGTLLD